MHRKLLMLGSVSGLVAIILGAFGSHGLENLLSKDGIATFETGVRYQFYHSLFALLIGSFSFLTSKTKTVLFYLLLVGIILFSGSIYFLATNSLTDFDFKKIGFITPIGGLLLILSWLLLLIKLKNVKKE